MKSPAEDTDNDRPRTTALALSAAAIVLAMVSVVAAAAPGAKVFFALPNAQERADVIAYLAEQR